MTGPDRSSWTWSQLTPTERRLLIALSWLGRLLPKRWR